MVARLRSLVAALRHRARFEDRMRDEMRFHIDACADDLERSGLPRHEALRRARMQFGTPDAIKDDCRDARGLRFFDHASQDLRYAVRIMARTPGLTAAAILSLALGIGANTAVFSLMEAVMLRTLPVSRPEELFFLAHGGSDRPNMFSNYALFERYAARTDVFAGVTAYSNTSFKVPAPEGVENVTGLWVSGNFHGLLGVPMAHGRGFSAEPDRPPGGSAVAVISDSYWNRRYGRHPDVLGRTLTANGHVVTIVGVTAPEFTGLAPGSRPDITLPLSIRTLDEPNFLDMHDTWTGMPLVARLKPGVDRDDVRAATEAVFQQYMSEPENTWARTQDPVAYRTSLLVDAGRGSAGLRRQYSTPLTVLMGMVGLVLLIACANVANLLLVRGTARRKEVAIRLCVGGGRGRLVRQFLTESMLLAMAGGILGALMALWGANAIVAFFTTLETPLLLEVAPNGRVLAFTIALSLAAGIAFGLAPALKSTRIDLTPALKEGSVVSDHGTRRWLTGHVLVVFQVALTLIVVAIAGLLVRSLHNLKSLDAGFSAGNVLLFTIDSNGMGMTPARRRSLYPEIVEWLRVLPGVVSVAASRSSPVHTSGNAGGLHMPGAPDTIQARGAFMNIVTPEYFDTLRIPLVRGRVFTHQDTASARRVVVINETLARFYFGTRDPIGQTLSFKMAPDDLLEVVGIVKDTHQMNLREAPPRMVYWPLAQEEEAPSYMMIEIRTAQHPGPLAAAVRDAAKGVSDQMVVRYFRTMDQQIDASLVRERLLATLSTSFAALALVLAVIGLYGVMSYNVSRRTRELGIRMALGARRGTVLLHVLRQVLTVSMAGIIIGVIGALAASRMISSLLYDLSARDPQTLGGVSALLLATSLAAAFLPARRAALLDPVRAIRTE